MFRGGERFGGDSMRRLCFVVEFTPCGLDGKRGLGQRTCARVEDPEMQGGKTDGNRSAREEYCVSQEES